MTDTVLLADVARLLDSPAALPLHDICTEYALDPAGMLGLDDDFLALQLRWGLLYRSRTRPAPVPQDRMADDLDKIAEARRVLDGPR